MPYKYDDIVLRCLKATAKGKMNVLRHEECADSAPGRHSEVVLLKALGLTWNLVVEGDPMPYDLGWDDVYVLLHLETVEEKGHRFVSAEEIGEYFDVEFAEKQFDKRVSLT